LTYRPDIDGLRAVAVLAVVIFHSGVGWIPGGFAGVDVFFVISGFLISRIVISSLRTQSFSLDVFYVRRARRILPALYVVTGSTFFLAVLVLLPLELIRLSESILSTNLFISNLLFWKQAGYFDAVAELKPLLHTWSLAVEEQFYLVWPLLLAFTYRRGWVLQWVVLSLLLVSLVSSCLLLGKVPSAVFYLFPFRAWELLMGAMLAAGFMESVANSRYKHGVSMVGLGLLVLSVFLLNKSLPFPGWAALPPVAGAMLLIAAGKDAVVNRYVLGSRPLVFVGLISYSLYLWHWPLLAYVRIANLGQLPVAQAAVAITISFVLAWFTWRYVEQPFRAVGAVGQPGVLLAKFALPGVLLCLGATTTLAYQGFPGRINARALAAQDAALDFNTSRSGCHLNMANMALPEFADCTSRRPLGNAANTVLVWGDSHAEAMVPGVVVMPGLNESEALQMTKTSCPPLIGAQVLRAGVEYRECEAFNKKVLDSLIENKAITTVVLAARWPVYVLGTPFGVPEELPGAPGYALAMEGANKLAPRKSGEVLELALANTVNLLNRSGKKVVVVGAVPEMRFNVPACVARSRMSLLASVDCGLDQSVVRLRIAQANAAIAKVASLYQAKAVYPDSILCQRGYCIAEGNDGQVLYYDHNHLTTAGARYVFSQLTLKD
jgi:peptidoglycan/LPS O-acetylase OafA/YrhL